MKRILLATFAIMTFGSVSALAADLPQRAAPARMTPPNPQSTTGPEFMSA